MSRRISPAILILDEPTSGVDPKARDVFWDMLLELAHRDGVTIFIMTNILVSESRAFLLGTPEAPEPALRLSECSWAP